MASPLVLSLITTPKNEITTIPTIIFNTQSKILTPVEPLSYARTTKKAAVSKKAHINTFPPVLLRPGMRFWVTAAVPKLN